MRDEFEPLRAFARLEREWARRTQELVAARRKLAALVQSQPLTHELEADIGALRQCIARLEQQLDLSHQVSEA
ncbi:MAG: hypothetical protein JNJ54_25935, partial [Myxococcaceae bacterium]|nr:hypothetical protein [Myxococcaceae bacterium]